MILLILNIKILDEHSTLNIKYFKTTNIHSRLSDDLTEKKGYVLNVLIHSMIIYKLIRVNYE
jgi:hypothetical protein